MRDLFASLTSRLVLTAVALVVLVAVLIGAAATAALNAQLTHQLDDDLHAVAGIRPGPAASGPGEGPPPGRRRRRLERARRRPADAAREHHRRPAATAGRAPDATTIATCSDDVLDVLADVPADRQVHEVDLPGLGTYRVIAAGALRRHRGDRPADRRRSTRRSPR